MPRFTRQSVDFWTGFPIIADRLAIENYHDTGTNGEKYNVNAYNPKGICENTLTGTTRGKYAAIEGENRKFDTLDSQGVQNRDNIRGLLLLSIELEARRKPYTY